MTIDPEYGDLALVDVELFVSGGVPRHAFRVLPEGEWWSPNVPKFRLDDDALLGLGWQRNRGVGNLQRPAGQESDPGLPHPYALGPLWMGANCWRADFLVGNVIVLGLVDHSWTTTHLGTCDPGDALASGSPWQWHVVGPESGAVCGRAETPVGAAFFAEEFLVASGAHIGERTALRRIVPT